ncbi:TOMM precursor leader peptide-binding protein [Salinithrix halophila]|uniref:TOMM leader peptide-binding protein n=1 Tax=Salinithrix halophila TaxID=1485204 RepID=A0ABV8JDQ9_9BACL
MVAVVGEGLLADFVFGKLSTEYQVIRWNDWTAVEAEKADLALVLHDSWDPSVHHQAEEVIRGAGIPWLRGFVSFGEGVVGPLVRPGTPGCSRCADTRLLVAGPDSQKRSRLQQKLAAQGGIVRDPWSSRTALLQMAYLLDTEARKVIQGSRSHLDEGVFIIHLKTLGISRHFFLPDPLCSVCSRLPDDSSAASSIHLQPSPKVSRNRYRSRSIKDLKDILVKDYLDHRTGILNGKMHDLASTFADAGVKLPLFAGDEGTGGRTHSYTDSECTAILEGLERYCGLEPRGKRITIHDRYQNLRDQALNPLKVGVHAKEQYDQPHFPFKPFDPDRPIHWAWGYSLLQERPILVPKSLAYFGPCGGESFVFETSNGCALGGTLEEAIFYGLLEVVERDSFLMTWYAQLPVPRLDPASADDRELQLMIDRFQTVTGYHLSFFNTTMENSIPSVWVVAQNQTLQGAHLICAAGAHLDPIRAVKSAIHELSSTMVMINKQYEAKKEKVKLMFHDSSLVRQMEDHSLLYGLPKAQERLQFLLDKNRPLRRFDEEFKRTTQHRDLTKDLKNILQRFYQLNLDVIVVNQTTPEIHRNGLFCVKVLIPGMLPMTFGHHLIRLEGLERVLRVPVELGYTKQPLTLDQLNPHPHPFP